MNLKHLLDIITNNTIVKLNVNGKVVIFDEVVRFYENFNDTDNDNFIELVDQYKYEDIDGIEWDKDGIEVYIVIE